MISLLLATFSFRDRGRNHRTKAPSSTVTTPMGCQDSNLGPHSPQGRHPPWRSISLSLSISTSPCTVSSKCLSPAGRTRLQTPPFHEDLVPAASSDLGSPVLRVPFLTAHSDLQALAQLVFCDLGTQPGNAFPVPAPLVVIIECSGAGSVSAPDRQILGPWGKL